MKFKTTVGLAALSAALWGIASAASAQSYSRVVIFGDSLSDNGNIPVLMQLANEPPPYQPPPPYYNYHFSNGPTYVEDAAAALGISNAIGHFGQTTGSVDWAVGGAETGTGNYESAALPGMAQEIGGYTGLGGKFGPNDLVVMWGGANDIFAGIQPAAVSQNPTGYIGNVGVAAATQMATYAGQVASLGAGTVVVPNLPPLAATPQFNQGPFAPAAPIAQAGANAFNAALASGLAADAKADPHTNFILLDTNTTLQVILAKPQAFGYANSTDACITTAACVGGSQATQNGYVFWDSVHPTASTHALLAAIMIDYLTYGDRGASMGVETESSLRQRTQSFDAGLGRLQGRDFAGETSGVGVALEYDDAQIDQRADVASTRDASETLRINLDAVASPTLKFGGLVGFSNAQVNAGPLRFRDETVSIDALLAWRSGKLFVNADAGVGLDDVADIRRQTAVPGLANTGSTSGWSGGVKVQAGAWFDLANHWTISPRAAISWAHGSVAGYTEVGPFDRYQYNANGISVAALEGTVRVSGPFVAGTRAHLEAGYRDNVSYDAGAVGTNLADNVSQVLTRTLSDPEAGVGLVDAGLNGTLCKRLKWDVGYRGRFGSKYDDNLARAGLNVAF